MVSVPSCPLCSGKRPFCIHKSYPLPRDFSLEKQVKEKLKQDVFGPSTSLFIGRKGYPDVLAGPMVALDEKPHIDSPNQWFGMDYPSIIQLRTMLIRSKQKENIFSKSRFVADLQDLALANRPTDVEVLFKKIPTYHFVLSESFQPMGPSASLQKMTITENVKIQQRVEHIARDELKVQEAAHLLYDQGLDTYKITTIFSSGILGLQKKQKLVPTRFSITAIDDIIAKNLMNHIREYHWVSKYSVFQSSYMDNAFTILLMPGSWEFENFEVWAPGSNWSKQTQSRIIPEYEPYHGRTTYAEGQAGGYYASRISAVRYLEKIKKQARVVVFREVSEGYTVPLGVWVVRETAAKAFENPPQVFNTKQEALDYLKTQLKVPLRHYIPKSRILGQRTLADFSTN